MKGILIFALVIIAAYFIGIEAFETAQEAINDIRHAAVGIRG